MQRKSYILQNLQRYKTLSELRRSAFFSESRDEIESFFLTPQFDAHPEIRPRLSSFIRVVQWNIEKGKRLPEIITLFRNDDVLKWADVVLLNEADCGMCRSGNLHVARALAEAMEMNMVFGPAHFELTRGTDEDLEIQGENTESLQGNAVLSRHPIVACRVISLPVVFEPYEFHEKRYGRRNCVWAKLQAGADALWVGAVHLEVRKIPRRRAFQMNYLLRHLPGDQTDAHLLAGDLNTNGFSRGNFLHTVASVWRLIQTPPSRLRHEFRHPEESREPLFCAVREAGFSWDRLNSDQATACAPIGNLEDSKLVPGFIADNVQRRLQSFNGHFSFKLDWFLGKGVRGLMKDEALDRATGIASVDPGCRLTVRRGPGRLSDHSPIYADLLVRG